MVGLLLVSCSNPGTRVRPEPVVGQVTETLDAPDSLGRANRASLAREDILQAFRADPAGAVRQLHGRWAADFTESRSAELAEISSAAAARMEKRDPDAAAGLRMTATELAWPLAVVSQTSDERRTCRAIYNHNCGAFAERLHPAIRAGFQGSTIKGPLRSYRLRTVTSDFLSVTSRLSGHPTLLNT